MIRFSSEEMLGRGTPTGCKLDCNGSEIPSELRTNLCMAVVEAGNVVIQCQNGISFCKI